MNITGLLLEEKQKKGLISLLLLICCVISLLLLAFAPHSSTFFLKSLEQADSLIVHDLNKFNISNQQVNVRNVRLDSTLTRKVYDVAVPPGFSKTQLHLEFSQTFYPYNISVPGKVVFPQKDVIIHLVYQQAVIRSIKLQTDSDLVMERNTGSIMVAFDSAPAGELVEKIVSFGEPIPLVLIIDNPVKAGELKNRLEDQYPHVQFWLKDEEGNNVLNRELSQAFTRLQHLEKSLPNATVLSFPQLTPAGSQEYVRLLSRTSLSYVDVSEAILLDSNTGHAAFQQELTKFVRKAQKKEHPIAIVKGNNESLNWLKDELVDFKKAGLDIVLPRKRQF